MLPDEIHITFPNDNRKPGKIKLTYRGEITTDTEELKFAMSSPYGLILQGLRKGIQLHLDNSSLGYHTTSLDND